MLSKHLFCLCCSKHLFCLCCPNISFVCVVKSSFFFMLSKHLFCLCCPNIRLICVVQTFLLFVLSEYLFCLFCQNICVVCVDLKMRKRVFHYRINVHSKCLSGFTWRWALSLLSVHHHHPSVICKLQSSPIKPAGQMESSLSGMVIR